MVYCKNGVLASRGRAQLGPWAKPLLVENISKYDIAIFAFIADRSVQYEMEEKSIWRHKSGRASNACQFGTKNAQATARPAQ